LITLVITSGPQAGEVLELDGESTLGREGADLVILDAEISRRHAILRPVAGGVEVEDLGSRNGTTVDGQRIDSPVTAGPGATIRVGTTTVTVQVEIPVPDATRLSPALPVDSDRTVLRPRPEFAPTRVGQTPQGLVGGEDQPRRAPPDHSGAAPPTPPPPDPGGVSPAAPDDGAPSPPDQKRRRPAPIRLLMRVLRIGPKDR
jgi:pSer/pThr/pTyr-binding forkhead associated (FHA) protein